MSPFAATWYINGIENPVSNVTICARTPSSGRTWAGPRCRASRPTLEYRLGTRWRVAGAYLFNDAKVTENPTNPELVGKYLAQVPQHRGSIQFAYTDPRYVNLALGLQMAGKQYDDDLNARGVPANGCAVQSQSCDNPGLPGFTLLDFTASRALGRASRCSSACRTFSTRRSTSRPTRPRSARPRLVQGGVRVRFAGR